MMPHLHFKYKELIFLFAIFLVASVLILAHLSNRYLWQDEAETALVSKTILQYGLPKAYDGKNFFSQEEVNAYGKNYLWTLDPWLPYYLLAGFFRIFGVSTLTARLPFALLGIATVILTYFFAKILCKDRKIAALTVIILLLNVPFLLLVRQCRYYSLVAFLSLLGLYGYCLLAEKTKTGSWLFCIAALLTFHTNQLFCAALLAAVCCHALLFQRKLFARTFILSGLVVLLNLPWLIFVSGLKYVSIYGFSFFRASFFLFFRRNLFHIHHYIFPFYLLLIPLVRAVFLGLKHQDFKAAFARELAALKCLWLPVLFTFFNIFALSLTSPASFFRYLTQLIPVLCVIPAVLIYALIKPRFKTGLAVILLSFFAFSFVHFYYYNFPLPGQTVSINARTKTDYFRKILLPYAEKPHFANFFDYLYEITTDFDSPVEGIVKYLQKYSRDSDIVAITYEGLPVAFYTNLKVICGSTGEDLSLVKKAPWIIIRKYGLVHPGSLRMENFIRANIPLKYYRKIEIDYPDIPWSNRPEPLEHDFRTPVNEDHLIIYRRPAAITWPASISLL